MLNGHGVVQGTEHPKPGERFGRWSVSQGGTRRDRQGSVVVPVACECGRESVVRRTNLLRGTSRGCQSCAVRERNRQRLEAEHARLSHELVGRTFGQLTVVELLRSPGEKRVVCECDCGARVEKLLRYVRSGRRQFCGRYCPRRYSRADRFWAQVRKTDGCWEWQGTCTPKNYGVFGGEPAHRVAWELVNGPIPPGLEACHKCDSPPCVRPDHLFLGTHQDNMRDAASKGRMWRAPGEANPAAKLTWDEARQIRCDLAAGETVSALSRRFGVSRAAIRNVREGRTWVDDEIREQLERDFVEATGGRPDA